MLTVFVDPNVATSDKRRDAISQACADIKAKVDFIPQIVENTVSWQPPASSSEAKAEDIHSEVLAVLEADEAVNMIHEYFQRQRGAGMEGLTLTEWVSSVVAALPGRHLTVVVVGMNKYFSKQKLETKQKFREQVTGEQAKGKKKTGKSYLSVTVEEAEEVYVEVQMLTGCILHHVDTDEQLAKQIQFYTKAVSDKTDKKDRLNDVFSFLEEGSSGLGVNKSTGEGLGKVWKQQLMQLKNFGPEMSEAVQRDFPSPSLLQEACEKCTSAKDVEQLLGEINVRRNASVISTNRKIGKEHARRIHILMTSTDPDEIVK